jgi:glycosyltransferase involved in cell wall biosynthesis
MRPKVSVTMPVLNGERYIAEAIESIAAQSYRNVELVVVDDGSTDGTRDVVERFRGRLDIRYVHHARPLGIAPSMNDGVRNSSGDLIAFLDHDDAWMPDFLETQVSYLEQHPDVGMVHSDFRTTDVNGSVIEDSVALRRNRKRPSGHVFPQLFMDSFIVGNSVLIRRECFERLGMFDESLRWGDYHMWMRIARHYKVDYVPKVLTSYRQHPTQSTRSVAVARPDEDPVALQAIRKILDAYPEVRRELGEQTVQRRIASFYFDLAWAWYAKGAGAYARVCLRRALALWPANPRYLVLYAASFVRPSRAFALSRALRSVLGSGGQKDATRGAVGTTTAV